jgi:hypothetical protein
MQVKTMIIAIAETGLFGALMASAAPLSLTGADAANARSTQAMLEEGKKTFRYESEGDPKCIGRHRIIREVSEDDISGESLFITTDRMQPRKR